MSKITIFEGPDGSGKSTAAAAYAKLTNARLVHCGVFPQVQEALGRLYVEAMLPALLGYQDVVLDRCWHSEPIYGGIYRGNSRLNAASCRMLDRLAYRCGAMVVLCLPDEETVVENWGRRHRDGGEYVTQETQIRRIYGAYEEMAGRLDVTVYDYKDPACCELTLTVPLERIMNDHPLEWQTAGNLNAPVMLIGEDFGNVKNNDALYQWPFASFSNVGCSQWLTKHLDAVPQIEEHQLCWVNADEPNLAAITQNRPGYQKIIALGKVAGEAMERLGEEHVRIRHPQHAKRFGKSYELTNAILEIL